MDDLQQLKGIGPKTLNYLNKLNIYKIIDLIYYFPFRYEVLKRSDILSLNQDEKIIIDGQIETIPIISRFNHKMNKMSFRLLTSKLPVTVIIFNRAFLSKNIIVGKNVTIIGKWDKKKNTIIASDILFYPLTNEIKVEPIYRTTNGLNKKTLRNFIEEALKFYFNQIIDYVPSYLKEEYNFLDKNQAVYNIHYPTSEKTLKQAMLRLKYEELFMFMLKINYLKEQNKKVDENYKKEVPNNKLIRFVDSLPFSLTFDQQKVVDEILTDLKASKRMNRLIQGDVGSGKTIVAVIAIYASFLANYQSALMAPTEILVKQHYFNIRKLFKDTDVVVELLVGSLSKNEKNNIYERLEKGEINLVIGTHALIQEGVKFHNLGLVVTDEQHRFGVHQRSLLNNKGEIPDILYMSATPIPRTYALTIYGDMDISTIKTIPKGRKEIKTYLKSPKDIKEILGMIKIELDLNHQIYIIAPLIEESEKIELENVNKLERQFNIAFGEKFNIGILHGKMKTEEKEEIMNNFLNKKIDILISTTVLEVGIDVPNATMMIIFDANRFGLSTLHQLRGRVGRSELQSYCILVSDEEKERLKVLTTTNDGFEISEADFKLRGHGDLFGYRQSGDMNFKIANIKKDFKILVKAKEDAVAFIEDNLLDEYPFIKEEINKSVNLD